MIEMFFFFFFLSLLTVMNMLHPFSFGAMLLLGSIILGGMVSAVSISWYGFVLFLIFVGGLLVLFGYTCALTPKLKMWEIGFSSVVKLSYLGGFVGSVMLINWGIELGLLENLMSETIMGSEISSKVGILFPSFLWDVSIVWMVLLLFFVMVLVAYICKKQSFPLRAFKKG